MFSVNFNRPEVAVRLADLHAALLSSACRSALWQGPQRMHAVRLLLLPAGAWASMRSSVPRVLTGARVGTEGSYSRTLYPPGSNCTGTPGTTVDFRWALWESPYLCLRLCCGGPPARALEGAESALLPRAARRWTASRRRCRAAPSTPPSCPATAARAARLCTRRSALPWAHAACEEELLCMQL
jgi:hypothetical protein